MSPKRLERISPAGSGLFIGGGRRAGGARSRRGRKKTGREAGAARQVRLKVRVGRVETNGVETHYWEVGSGPALVLVHGLGFDLTQWRAQMRFFASDYRVIVYDLRGHGLSGGKDRSFQFMDWVHDLRALLGALGIAKPFLCGHGLGGEIVLQYAITYPRDVAAMVVADAPGPRRLLTSRLSSLLKRPLVAVSRLLWPWRPLGPLARLTQTTLYSRSFRRGHRDAMASFRRGFESQSADTFLRASAAQVRRPDNSGELARIEIPVLLLRGTQDKRLSLAEVFRYRHRIPSAQLHHIHGSGHMIAQERPFEFNKLARGFFLGRLQEERSWPSWSYELGLWRLGSATLLGALAFAGALAALGGSPLAYGALIARGAPSAVFGAVGEPGMIAGCVGLVVACLGYALAWPLVFARVQVSRVTGWLVYGLAAAFASILLLPGASSLELDPAWRQLTAFLAMAGVFGWVFFTTCVVVEDEKRR